MCLTSKPRCSTVSAQVSPVDTPTSRLVQQARTSRPESFSALFERLAPRLYAWASIHILPPLRQRLDPEDLLQEVWFRAFDNFSNYDARKGSFRKWTLGIAYNVLLSELKKLNRSPGKHGNTSESGRQTTQTPLEAIEDPMTSISRRLAKKELMQRFLAKVDSLKAIERQIVLYRGLEGLSHAEVAKRLGMTPEAAESRWRRVRKRLQEIKGISRLFYDS